MIELKVALNHADKDRALAVLEPLGRAMAVPAAGLRIVGEALLREQNRRFKSQTSPDGAAWAALSPLTQELRGKAGPILRVSGRLMRSGAYQVSGSTLAVGLNTIYAAVHQYGATITPKSASMLAIPARAGRGGRNANGFVFAKSVTIPARPIVGFGVLDERAARRAVEDWIATMTP